MEVSVARRVVNRGATRIPRSTLDLVIDDL
jgi:hypothetical protein